MRLDTIRAEIERMRGQVVRQRKEIRQLERAGIPTTAAEALLQRMLDKIDGLCLERDRLKREQPRARGGVGRSA
ncbi:MAG TPA: hypothetical protein VE865_16450 [Bradyrhizobium sp.]|nr:hypothetical protein [Bradyrhizobium sp.]